VRQRKDLDPVVEDFIDDAIGFVEHLADRRFVPLRDNSTLLREVSEQFDPSDQTVEPFEGSVRPVERDVIDCRLSPPSRGGRPDDPQRRSLALSSATTSSWGTPSPRANSSLAWRMSRMSSISSTKASY
jgi:hypothetical protein